MTSFDPLFVPAELREAVSGRAWLDAMLAAEQALTAAAARAGIVPPESAEAVAAVCASISLDFDQLAADGRAAANPVVPLVRELRRAAGPGTEEYIHVGATSQDIMDSAAMLVAGRALDLVLAEVDRAAAACTALARRHRSTPMAARTLLQQAVPTTFGLRAACWLVELGEAADHLRVIRRTGLAAQLGGAAGTLAAFGPHGLRMLDLFAAELDLAVPTLPWHTDRTRIARLGAALDLVAGAVAKIGLDVVLLAQTEVGEVSESAPGGSSTMPQKRNPAAATLARAAARIAAAHTTVLTGSLAQELERAAGAWQAEWESLSGALAYTGGAAAAIAGALETLEVDERRMRTNLDLTGGLIAAEQVSFLLAARIGREAAHELVAAAAESSSSGGSFRDALLADPRCDLTAVELDSALDPVGYLGSAEALVDRALERHDDEARP